MEELKMIFLNIQQELIQQISEIKEQMLEMKEDLKDTNRNIDKKFSSL